MLTVLHGSDLHFGKPHRPSVAAGFLDMAQKVAPDVIALAGDFTQRAKVREFEQARTYLRQLLDVPVVVTPGNHDVPLYRVHERLFAPFRNYRAFVSEKLDTVTRVGGAVFVALNSTDPHRGIVNGRIEDAQLRFLARIFRETYDANVRIVVMHHALAPPLDGGSDRTIPRNGVVLDRFRSVGVDLVLSGHLHRGFVTHSSEVRPDHRNHGDIAIVHSGTAASSRGRAAEKGANSVNVLKVGTEKIEVIPHWFERDGSGFVACEPITIRRSE
jgi:3',5'-cyclic AMP phosphodiesterase CpdA